MIDREPHDSNELVKLIGASYLQALYLLGGIQQHLEGSNSIGGKAQVANRAWEFNRARVSPAFGASSYASFRIWRFLICGGKTVVVNILAQIPDMVPVDSRLAV